MATGRPDAMLDIPATRGHVSPYDARSAAIIMWSHHWAHPATREESETIGTFYVH